MATADALALADAILSSISALCAGLGFAAIRRRRIRRHQVLMTAAVAASTLFLALFVTRFVQFGFAKFDGDGPVRVLYMFVFFSHEPIAVVSVPLVLVALVLGWTRSDRVHREVARIALPIWLYAQATGVALYVLLYLR